MREPQRRVLADVGDADPELGAVADGGLAVAGLKAGVASDLDYDEARLRRESGLLDGVETIG